MVEIADELITINELDTFYRQAIELAREKLGVERCGLFVLDSNREYLVGTYGTDGYGRTTDEHGILILGAKNFQEFLGNRADPWTLQEIPQTYWDGEQVQTLGSGWVASTIIRMGDEPVGLFSNDTAITRAPLDPTQQEAIVLY